MYSLSCHYEGSLLKEANVRIVWFDSRRSFNGAKNELKNPFKEMCNKKVNQLQQLRPEKWISKQNRWSEGSSNQDSKDNIEWFVENAFKAIRQ